MTIESQQKSFDFFKDAFKVAIVSRDLPKISRMVDSLRARGHRYMQCQKLAEELTGISLYDWETLMDECENEDSKQ